MCIRDRAVVYGLRARANLLMQKWADAAKDAERAIAGGTCLLYTSRCV